MRKFLVIFVFLNLFFVNQSFSYEYLEKIGWYTGKVFKIAQNDDYKVVVSTSETWADLKTLVEQKGGVAWINWAYFCPKDYKKCWGKNSIHWDRISNWIISSKWKNTGVRYVFGFTKDNKPLIHKSPDIQPDKFEWIYNWISNFPLILKNWKSSLLDFEKNIDSKMKLRWPKNFICSTKNNDIYMWYISNQTIYTMVEVLKNMGCYNALNLDSGWSLAVYNKWYKKVWWRQIMDSFVIVPKDNTINNNKISEDNNKKIETKIKENKNKITVEQKNKEVKKVIIKKIQKEKVEKNISEYTKSQNLKEAKKTIVNKIKSENDRKLDLQKKFLLRQEKARKDKQKISNQIMKNNLKNILIEKKEKSKQDKINYKKELYKKKILSKNYLTKNLKINKFIVKIDKIIEKLDKNKLEKVLSRISILKEKLEKRKSNILRDYLLSYFETEIILKLNY